MHRSYKWLIGACIASSFLACNQEKIDTNSYTSWNVTGGDDGISHYSKLEQITKENVKNLKPVWTHHSGSVVHNQCNPIVIDTTMFYTTGYQELVSVNAKTGAGNWKYKPSFDRLDRPEYMNINRGVGYWTDGAEQRVFFCAGNLMLGVDGKTGKALGDFGDNGKIDMNEGHHKPANKMGVTVSSSPVVVGDLVIVGASSWSAASHVAAYNVKTGERVWKFNTIPHKGEDGHETYGDPHFWKKGAGVNVWGGISVDKENDMLFFGTGQPKADFYDLSIQGNIYMEIA